jgi:hypothetical protein
VTKNKLSRIPRIRSFQKMDSEVNIGIEGDSKGTGYINELMNKEMQGDYKIGRKRESVERNRCPCCKLQHLVLHTNACG